MPHILVVDDNATNLTLFRHLLRKIDGAAVECYADSVAALGWCTDNEPDLILLDYMMPAMDGLEFIRRLQSIPGRADVPVVMVTADTQSDVRHRALELGGATDDAKIEFIAERLLARPPSSDEMAIVKKSLADLVEWYKAHPDDAKQLITVGDSKPRATDPVQLASWTMLTNELMNLDEVLCK